MRYNLQWATTTQGSMVSMCSGGGWCCLLPLTQDGLSFPGFGWLCLWGLGWLIGPTPNPSACLVCCARHRGLSFPACEGRFRALYKVANPSKRLGLNKRAFYDFPSKSSWEIKAHREWARVDGKFRIIQGKRAMWREGGGPSKGIWYLSWKAWPNLPHFAFPSAVNLQHEVVIHPYTSTIPILQTWHTPYGHMQSTMDSRTEI